MARTKRDQYREILDKIVKIVNNNSNIDDVECGNRMHLVIEYPDRLFTLLRRFQRIKKGS